MIGGVCHFVRDLHGVVNAGCVYDDFYGCVEVGVCGEAAEINNTEYNNDGLSFSIGRYYK